MLEQSGISGPFGMSPCAVAAKVHVDRPEAASVIARALGDCLGAMGLVESRELVIVCIGTDRSTGDSLGPLVGSKLTERLALVDRGSDYAKHGSEVSGDNHTYHLAVYGTLDEPVHAANLADWVQTIATNHSNAAVVAVDACLGKNDNVGSISVRPGPLKPGTGVNKSLPSVGHVHLIGVVNVGGFMEYLVLQNTRLSLVMRMASAISDGIWSFAMGVCGGLSGQEPSWSRHWRAAPPDDMSGLDEKGSPAQSREMGATRIAAGVEPTAATAQPGNRDKME